MYDVTCIVFKKTTRMKSTSMKKLIVALSIGAVFLACFYLFESIENTKIEKPEQHQVNTKTVNNIVSPAESAQNKMSITQRVKQLKIAKVQCKQRKSHYLTDISDIHQELIQVLEDELQQGKTDR